MKWLEKKKLWTASVKRKSSNIAQIEYNLLLPGTKFNKHMDYFTW